MLEPTDKYAVVFAVCRLHARAAHDRGGALRQRDFAVVKVVHQESAAQEEVERLNAMNRAKGDLYFYQATRLDREA